MQKFWIAAAGLTAVAAAAAAVVEVRDGQATFALDTGPKAAMQAAVRTGELPKAISGAGIITTIAGTGVAGSSGDGGLATQAELASPTEMAVDPAGTVYVVDQNRVRKIGAGTISPFAGNGTYEFAAKGTLPTGDNAAATGARFGEVSGLAADGLGNVYIADSVNRRIRKVSPQGIIRTVAGAGIAALSNAPSTYAGEGGAATAATLSYPTRLAAHDDGTLVFCDFYQVRQVSSAGVITTLAGANTTGLTGDGGPARDALLEGCSGIAIDARRNVYVSDDVSGRVRRIDTAGTITTVAGGGRHPRDNIATNIDLPGIQALAAQANGTVHVLSSSIGHRVGPEGVLDTPVGMIAWVEPVMAGFNGFAGDGGPADYAHLSSPGGIGTDALGNVYVADTANHRIRKITATPPAYVPAGVDTFRPYVPVPMQGQPAAVAVADVTGDRRDDLLVLLSTVPDTSEETGAEMLAVYPQNGDGTLAAPVSVAMPTRALSLTTADFNRDGIQDIVMGHAKSVGVVLGNVARRLDIATLGSRGSVISAPVVLDANGDGHTDIVVSEGFYGIGPTVYAGDGRGGFAAKPLASSVSESDDLTAGDFNADGVPDLLSRDSFNQFRVMLRGTNGSFATGQWWRNYNTNGPVTTGDWNGDARKDILYGVYLGASAAYDMYRQGAGGTYERHPIPAFTQHRTPLGADMNGDGLDDLLVLHAAGFGVGYLQQTNGALDEEVKFPLPMAPMVPESVATWTRQGLAVGDLNGDGCRDIALYQPADDAAATSPLVILHAKRCRTLRTPGDFDGDRRADVVWRNGITGANEMWRAATPSQRLVLTARADTNWKVAGVGDFDGNGKADVFWRHAVTGANELWRSASAQLALAVGAEPTAAWRVAGVGDFDNDGRDDLFWRHAGTGANGVWWSANRSTSQSAAAVSDANWQVAGVGDFTGDGKDDVFWRNGATGANDLWASGSKGLRRPMTAVTVVAWQVVGVDDFNGDRVADVLWRNQSTGANVIWLFGKATAQRQVATVADLNWQVAGTSDYDGDGKADILWRHKASGANELWSEGNLKFRKVLPAVGTTWAVMPK